MSDLKLYGIPNCDKVRKARNFLKGKVEYEFVDFKKSPPSRELLFQWKEQLNDFPVNKRGPSFRAIKEKYEDSHSENVQAELLQKSTSAIKRPILEYKKRVVVVGFDEGELSRFCSEKSLK